MGEALLLCCLRRRFLFEASTSSQVIIAIGVSLWKRTLVINHLEKVERDLPTFRQRRLSDVLSLILCGLQKGLSFFADPVWSPWGDDSLLTFRRLMVNMGSNILRPSLMGFDELAMRRIFPSLIAVRP
ncbi:hypothetical protein M514_15763 [Trichuris suis]|uniref:Uncharacterized protein n=1 Tax=Trichuris suis TaxID=68888 RepID=A0A085NRG5_9BILA|nr:hypothetical protein M514_15763 [Trichuris suis]